MRARTREWFEARIPSVLRLGALPDIPDFGAVVKAVQYVIELLAQYPGGAPKGGLTVAFPEGGKDGDFAEWNEGAHRLTLWARHFGTHGAQAKLGRRLLALERSGQNPRGCTSVEYVIAHEFGHCLRYRLDRAKYWQWGAQEAVAELGRYAQRSPSEAFAEGFAVITQTPRNSGPALVVQLHQLLREDDVR